MKFNKTVIDSHMHTSALVDSEGVDLFSFFDGLQEKHGLKGLNICSYPIGCGVENNVFSLLYKLHNPTAYAYGGFVYPDKPAKNPMPEGFDFKTQYEELLELGFDGIKMLETKTTEVNSYKLDVSDGRYDGYFSKCEKDGTHIIWHVADPDSFWDINRISKRHYDKGWFYGNGDYPSWEEIYDTVYKVLEKNPKLNVTFAHFFFYSEYPERLVELFEKYENVGVDITPGSEMYRAFGENNEFYRNFFIKYADRITFGTDVSHCGSKVGPLRLEAVYKFLTSSDEVTVVDVPTRGINLPDDVCEKILHKNFEKVAGEKPKNVNISALKKYIEKYKDCFKHEKHRKFAFEAVEKL